MPPLLSRKHLVRLLKYSSPWPLPARIPNPHKADKRLSRHDRDPLPVEENRERIPLSDLESCTSSSLRRSVSCGPSSKSFHQICTRLFSCSRFRAPSRSSKRGNARVV